MPLNSSCVLDYSSRWTEEPTPFVNLHDLEVGFSMDRFFNTEDNLGKFIDESVTDPSTEEQRRIRVSLALDQVEEIFPLGGGYRRYEHELHHPKSIPVHLRKETLRLLRIFYDAHRYSAACPPSTLPSLCGSSEVSSGSSLTDFSTTWSVSSLNDVRETTTVHLSESLRTRKAVLRKLGACFLNCRTRKVKCKLYHHKLRDLLNGNHSTEVESIVEWAIQLDGPSVQITRPYEIEHYTSDLQEKNLRPRDEILDKIDKMFDLRAVDLPESFPLLIKESSGYLENDAQNPNSQSNSIFQAKGLVQGHTQQPPVSNDKGPKMGQDRIFHDLVHSTLSPMKQSMIELVMSKFYVRFQTWLSETRTHAGTPSTSVSTSSTGRETPSTPATSISTSSTHKRRRMSDNQSENGDDNGDNQKRPRYNLNVPHHINDKTLQFACPYRKHDPRKYNMDDFKCCATSQWRLISRVKEHLYRSHRLPLHCQRCSQVFEHDTELKSHSQAPESCQVQLSIQLDGITNDMESQLRNKKKAFRSQSEAQQWYAIYHVLFPGSISPQSPYFDPILDDTVASQASSDLNDYHTFAQIALPRHFRQLLEPIVANEFQPLHEKILAMLEPLFRRAHEQTLSDFMSSQNPTGSASPAAIASLDQYRLQANTEEENAVLNGNTFIQSDVAIPSHYTTPASVELVSTSATGFSAGTITTTAGQDYPRQLEVEMYPSGNISTNRFAEMMPPPARFPPVLHSQARIQEQLELGNMEGYNSQAAFSQSLLTPRSQNSMQNLNEQSSPAQAPISMWPDLFGQSTGTDFGQAYYPNPSHYTRQSLQNTFLDPPRSLTSPGLFPETAPSLAFLPCGCFVFCNCPSVSKNTE